MARTKTRALVALAAALFLAAPHPAAAVGARTGGGGGGKTTTFITYPWRFAHLSDTHVKWGFGGTSQYPNSLALRAVTDTLNYLRTHGGMDFCLLTGDWAGGHTIVAHQTQIDSLYAAFINRATFPILPVMGNHEAIEADTLLGRNPFQQAQDRFQQWFQGRNYYTFKWKNVQWIALQNNVNYDITSDTDYGVDAPTYGGSVPGRDWDGIHAKTGTERKWLAATLAARDRSDWLLIGMHRPTYGSNLNNATRHNYNAGRGERFIKQVEDSLRSDERGIVFCGDQHIPVWLTKAIRDSSIASATGKGLYHSIVASGSGAREADTTEVFGGAGLQAFLYQDLDGVGNSLRNYGRTTGKWADTLSAVGFKGLTYQFTWSLCTVYGDQIQIEYFMTFMPLDAGNAQYRGAWKHRRIGSYTLYRDMAQEPGAVEVFDNSPPAAVSNLSATSVTGTGLTLNWTSPGDDGTTGTATSYEIRYSTSPYVLANFTLGTVVSFPPSPSVAGTAQTKAVTGLSPSTEYFFALRTTDDAGNVSPLSNGLNVFTTAAADVTPPAAVANLSVSAPAPTSLTVSWTAPGDDGSTGTVSAYDLRRSTSTINSGNFTSATQVSGMPGPAVAGTAQSKSVTGLLEGTTYYFALKTQDEVPNISSISNVVSGTTLDGTAPAAVADLTVTGTTASTVSLSWTSPGDDGSAGTATSYDLRYSQSTINSGNFSGASQATGEPTPAVAGTGQTFTLTGLTPSTTYYICLKTVDEASNASAVSNVPTGATIALDTTPPAAVANLSLGSRSSSGLTASWTSPGDDGGTGTATTYDLRYATSSVAARGRVENVVNGSTWSPANSPYTTGNFAQTVGAGAGSYSPLAAATKLLGQPHPMVHSIAGGTNPVTAGYAECLSAILGGTFQHHAVNETWNQTSSLLDGSIPVGCFGTPTGPGTIAGNLASRSFTHANVYVNLSTSVTQPRPGGTLAATGFYVDTTPGGFPGADCDACFPHQGGIYWDNLTVSNIDAIKGWTDIALSESNLNGPTDGNTHIPAEPRARVNALRAAAGRPIRIATQLNGFSIFISDTNPPNVPSNYYPQQVRLFNKANALHAFIYNTDGVTPLDHDLIPGVGNSSRLRYFDITNTELRAWLAADTDSLLHANGLDYLFMDQIESSLASEITVSGCTSGCWPTSAAWEAAWQDFFVRVNSGVAAATQVSGEPAPAVAGTSQSKAVTGLAAGTRYWFSLKTADELGNVSALSNVPSDTTTGVVGTQIYKDFNLYCTAYFGALTEPLIYSTYGSTPTLVAGGDWVYPSKNSASIGYETSLPCRAFVEYGATTSYGFRTPEEDRPFYLHLGQLTGLSPSTTYHYRLVAVDEMGQSVTSGDRTLTTGSFAGAILISSPGAVCSVDGATYLLTQDIVADTRGISITAENVTLDLNGFTVTYDNGTPVVPNGQPWDAYLYSSTSSSGVHYFRWTASGTVRILNGKIRQGLNGGSGNVNVGFNPICIATGAVEVAGIDAVWHGGSSGGINNQFGELNAHHNVLADGGTVIDNRNQGIKAIYGATVAPSKGLRHNLVKRARHQGLMVGGSSSATAKTDSNEVYVDSWATNAFCVGGAAEIFKNKLFGTGYHIVGTGFLFVPTSWIHSNLILMQGEVPNTRSNEYPTQSSVNGIRLTQYNGGTFNYVNWVIEDNLVAVRGRNGTTSVRGIQLFSDPYIDNLQCRNNTIKVDIQDDSTPPGACFVLQGTVPASGLELPVYYSGNTLITNSTAVKCGDDYGAGSNHQFRNNTFTKFGSRSNYRTIRMGYFDRNSYANRLIDNTAGAGIDFTNPELFDGSTGRRDYSTGHSLYIIAKGSGAAPLPSRTVTLYDNTGLSYTTTTDGSGVARLELVEDFYEALTGAGAITHSTRSGWNVRTSGYSNYTLSGGELSTSNNVGAPITIQFAP